MIPSWEERQKTSPHSPPGCDGDTSAREKERTLSHKIVHFELMGPDDALLASFYEDLFGWKSSAVKGFESYHLVDAEHAGIGGAIGRGQNHMPSYLSVYVEVDDVDAHLAKAEVGGATTVVPKTVMPGMATFALFTDPAGNMVGLVENEMPPAAE